MSGNAVRAELTENGKAIDVTFSYSPDDVTRIKGIIGRRFVAADRGGPAWRVPADMETGRTLRTVFGDRLLLGPRLLTWGRERRTAERNLGAIARADSWPLKDMLIGQKLPALAEWLRPYQLADIKFLSQGSMINGNEQGLGKTPETIGAIYEAGIEHGPHLVVAPRTSLEVVWEYEIRRWTTDQVYFLSGDVPAKQREGVLNWLDLYNPELGEGRFWVVCTAEMVRRNIDRLKKVDWASITVDEFHLHGLSNASGDPSKGTLFAQASRQLKAKRRYLLSGTPIGGKPIKLWGALHFLHPDKFTSKWQWAEQHLEIVVDEIYVRGGAKKTTRTIGGLKPGHEKRFYEHLAPYMVRRLKSEVLPQLPPKQYVDVWCNMVPKQKRQYKEFERSAYMAFDNDLEIFATIPLAEWARLKKMATAYCEAIERSDGHVMLKPTPEGGKINALLERLGEVGILKGSDASGDNVCVIASQHAKTVEMVYELLTGMGIPTAMITGDTSGKKRKEVIQNFQAGTGARVVVMTTTAGGVAITLDRADTVHILDETFNPDDQAQLEDRIHRASRIHQVTCYYYRTRGTIEEDIYELTREKEVTNQQILNELRLKYLGKKES
jgi:SNF2 family DNA or RNA helicase